MLKSEFQLTSGLIGSKDKENLADKILERGRVIGLYRRGSLSYRKMSKDVVNQITTKAMKSNQKFQEKMIYSTIKGKAYTLKLGSKDALPEIQRGQNFLCQIYGRKKTPYDNILPIPSRKHNENSILRSLTKSARINIDQSIKQIRNLELDLQSDTSVHPKKRFRRGVSQLVDNYNNSILKQISND